MENEPFVNYKKGTVKVYGKMYSNKADPACPKVLDCEDIIYKIIKAPIKRIIMRPLRHPQRYEVAWVLTKDNKSMPLVCLTWYIDTMRFFIDDGVHRCHAAYDIGYDYVPASIMLEEKEPEGLKEEKTFDGQPRNLFRRMQLPATKAVPETCVHRLNWKVSEKRYSGPSICKWCEFKYHCFKQVFGRDESEIDLEVC